MNFFWKYSANPNEDVEAINKFKAAIGKSSPPVSNRFSMNCCFPKMHKTFLDKCNLWLLKPTEYNRGRGINLFNKLSTFKEYLQIFIKNDDTVKSNKVKENDQNNTSQPQITQSQNINLVRTHKFVVQKYVERPLLFNSRKFDARVWALLDQDNNLYYFKEWYIRLSSEKFDLSDNLLENQYVHLTNNAIQKYGPNYGKQESGNILSWTALRVNFTI
jgi:Tubulin-tyrosine ligase family